MLTCQINSIVDHVRSRERAGDGLEPRELRELADTLRRASDEVQRLIEQRVEVPA